MRARSPSRIGAVGREDFRDVEREVPAKEHEAAHRRKHLAGVRQHAEPPRTRGGGGGGPEPVLLRLRLHRPRPRLAPPARGLVRPSGPLRARPRPRPRPAFADFCFALGGGEGRGRCSPLLCQTPAPCGAAPPAAALASGVPSRAAICHSFPPHVEARWPERPTALHLVVGNHAGRCAEIPNWGARCGPPCPAPFPGGSRRHRLRAHPLQHPPASPHHRQAGRAT